MKFLKNLGILLVLAFFIGCSLPQTSQTGEASIALSMDLQGVVSKQLSAKSPAVKGPQSITGTLTAVNADTAESTSYDWFALIDEDTFTISSSKTIVLPPGTYSFSLVLTNNSHQYAGSAELVPLIDGENTINMTVKPVIGEISSSVILTQLAALKFNYSTLEISSLTDPKIGYSIDGGNETIIGINKSTGLSEAYVNVSPGNHTITLTLYDGNLQIARSIAAQETVTITAAENVTMDLVPLHGEMVLNLALDGGDAVFTFTLPAEIAEEAGGLTDLQVILGVTGAENGFNEVELTLSQDANGTLTARTTLGNYKYDTVDLSLTFKDRTDGETLGSAVKSSVVLSDQSTSVLFDLELRRRALTTGSIQGVLGVNVFQDALPAAGAKIYVNGVFKGLAGSGSFGTAGYLKLHLSEGNYTISAETNEQEGSAGAVISPLAVKNVDIFLQPKDTNFLKGTVYDTVTGAELSGVTVSYNDVIDTTGENGEYVIPLNRTSGNTTGDLIIFKNTHNFYMYTQIDMNADLNVTMDHRLAPQDTQSYETRTVHGLFFEDGIELVDGTSLSIDIYSNNKGKSSFHTDYDSTNGGYSIDTPTFGSDCLIKYEWEAPNGDTGAAVITNRDLTAADTELNIANVSTGFKNNVHLDVPQDITSDMYMYFWITPYGHVSAGYDYMTGSGTVTKEIFNPNKYPVYLLRQTTYNSDPLKPANSNTYHATSGIFQSNETIIIPDQDLNMTYTVPASAADINYSSSSLSTAAIPGTVFYMWYIEKKYTVPENGYFYATTGTILARSENVTIPAWLETELAAMDLRVGFIPQKNNMTIDTTMVLPSSMEPGQMMAPDFVQAVSIGEENPDFTGNPMFGGPFHPYYYQEGIGNYVNPF